MTSFLGTRKIHGGHEFADIENLIIGALKGNVQEMENDSSKNVR